MDRPIPRGLHRDHPRSRELANVASSLEVFRSLPTRAVPTTPANDAVIPPAVTEAVAAALSASRSSFARLTYPEADHRLGLWFADSATRADASSMPYFKVQAAHTRPARPQPG